MAREPRHSVPSPVAPEARPDNVGEGQGGGDSRTSRSGVPPTPSPSPQGGGESGCSRFTVAAPFAIRLLLEELNVHLVLRRDRIVELARNGVGQHLVVDSDIGRLVR